MPNLRRALLWDFQAENDDDGAKTAFLGGINFF
jgi:hypothetical protein